MHSWLNNTLFIWRFYQPYWRDLFTRQSSYQISLTVNLYMKYVTLIQWKKSQFGSYIKRYKILYFGFYYGELEYDQSDDARRTSNCDHQPMNTEGQVIKPNSKLIWLPLRCQTVQKGSHFVTYSKPLKLKLIRSSPLWSVKFQIRKVKKCTRKKSHRYLIIYLIYASGQLRLLVQPTRKGKTVTNCQIFSQFKSVKGNRTVISHEPSSSNVVVEATCP